jgi:hypothetical protein
MLSSPRPAIAAGADASIRQVEAFVRKADFDAAEQAARKLLQSGSLARQEVARVYLQLGVIASARRDPAAAEGAFRNALWLDRDLSLHASAGPHVAETFARATASMPRSSSPGPVIELASAATGQLLVEAAARTPDDGLARRVSVRIAGVTEVRDLGPDAVRFSLWLPESVDGCATATASVLDEFGNELWTAVAVKDVCRPPPPGPASPVAASSPASRTVARKSLLPPPDMLSMTAPRSPRPVPRAVWVGAALTGGAAVATAVLGLVALERREDYDGGLGGSATPDQSRHLRELALTAEHRATAAAILTGVLAATTAVLYVRGRF